VAIGVLSGTTSQKKGAVAIGQNSGQTSQQNAAVAIGAAAGSSNQGASAVAIGAFAGYANQPAKSIIINATGNIFTTTQPSAFYVTPIRNNNSQTRALCWDTASGEITYSTSGTKTFVIPHPLDQEKYLVHACLEGPEAGVYYRGTASIPADVNFVELRLPYYVDALATEFTVQVTPVIENEEEFFIPSLAVTRVTLGKFKVYKTSRNTFPSTFDYLVFGKRVDIEVEPEKSKVVVKGQGPYTWL
jgi:hypothetical protein